MSKHRRYRAVFVVGIVFLLMAGACGLWLRSERRQEALNRQLIAALVNQDVARALVLVNQGADPNMPMKSMPPPSFRQMWSRIIGRSPMPVNNSPSAFMIACGEPWMDEKGFERTFQNAPQLVETMLRHGANKNAKGSFGRTPLVWSVCMNHEQTVSVLLHNGVDVNAQDSGDFTALAYAVMECAVHGPSRRKSINLVQQLLAHRADPNLTNGDGMTLLQWAQSSDRPDLVALLKQAGAKK